MKTRFQNSRIALALAARARTPGARSRAPRRGRRRARCPGPHGPGPADRPEVVRAVEPDDALAAACPIVLPEPHRLLVLAEPELGVAREDRHPEAVRVDLHVVEDELPGEVDRALLEVLAEREVAEHLEEREVEAVEADLVDVRACGRPSATVARSGAGGCSRPRKYGISGCMPALLRSVEWSQAGGTSEPDGWRLWPFDSKKERKPSRSSAVVRMRLIVRVALSARSASHTCAISSITIARGGGRASLP